MPRVRIRYRIGGVAILAVVGIFVFYATRPALVPPPLPVAPSVASPQLPPPPEAAKVTFLPRAQTALCATVRNVLLAAGVDEDKVGGPAADLEAAVSDAIHAQTDELRWYGEIAIGSLVPLWIVALVALFRHQRERIDLSQLESIVRQARRVAPAVDYESLIRRP